MKKLFFGPSLSDLYQLTLQALPAPPIDLEEIKM
jgi:hypothetical protein